MQKGSILSQLENAVEKANTEYQKAYDNLYGNETEMGLRNGGIYRDIQILEA